MSLLLPYVAQVFWEFRERLILVRRFVWGFLENLDFFCCCWGIIDLWCVSFRLLHGSQTCHSKRGLCNSMKLWDMPRRATQDKRVIGKSLTTCGPLDKDMATHTSVLAWRTLWTVWKGEKIWCWKITTTAPHPTLPLPPRSESVRC